MKATDDAFIRHVLVSGVDDLQDEAERARGNGILENYALGFCRSLDAIKKAREMGEDLSVMSILMGTPYAAARAIVSVELRRVLFLSFGVIAFSLLVHVVFSMSNLSLGLAMCGVASLVIASWRSHALQVAIDHAATHKHDADSSLLADMIDAAVPTILTFGGIFLLYVSYIRDSSYLIVGLIAIALGIMLKNSMDRLALLRTLFLKEGWLHLPIWLP